MQLEGRRERIVVVDDEDVLLTMIARLLTKAGYEVFLAGTAEAALDILARHADVDVLLTDVRMPGVSGPELAASLARRDPPSVVFMSGASDVSPEALRDLGARTFLKKPFRAGELLEAIRAGLPAPAAVDRATSPAAPDSDTPLLDERRGARAGP